MNKKESAQCKLAHRFSSGNKYLLEESGICGCFYCCSIYSADRIMEWVNDIDDYTALCPNCSIDSVIPKRSDYPFTLDFLKRMHDFWFKQ